MIVKYKYNSQEDFLATNSLSVDAMADDGWGAFFPVKGREIEATILFSDISGFSKRTLNLSPTETLIFVNSFFAWISAEALQNRPGIVDKYIGDEIMVVFSQEFGSKDPFVDAVQTARWMCERDALSFTPHIGIASGPVVVGYVGTPIKYNCSVFGAGVALAARCASVEAKPGDGGSGRIVFPASEWGNRVFDDVFPPQMLKGASRKDPAPWELRPTRKASMKNLGDQEIREIVQTTVHILLDYSAEQRAKETLDVIRKAGRYWPFFAIPQD